MYISDATKYSHITQYTIVLYNDKQAKQRKCKRTILICATHCKLGECKSVAFVTYILSSRQRIQRQRLLSDAQVRIGQSLCLVWRVVLRCRRQRRVVLEIFAPLAQRQVCRVTAATRWR